MTKKANSRPAKTRATSKTASTRRVEDLVKQLSPADRRFLEGWVAADPSLQAAVESVTNKAQEFGDTGLAVEMLTFTNGTVEYLLAHSDGKWQVHRVARGRPKEAVRRRQAAGMMKKAKQLLRPVAKSLRKHVREVRNPVAMKQVLWGHVEQECNEARRTLGTKSWRQLVADTDLRSFTLDSLAASLVRQVTPAYQPSVLAKLGRGSFSSPK